MTITIEIDTGNAAFDDDSGEVERILREYALEACHLGVTRLGDVVLHDINGNRVGSVKVSER